MLFFMVLKFTKEESRIPLTSIDAALLASLLGTVSDLVGTYAKFANDKEVQTKTSRNLAYTQLKGQQAELLMPLAQAAVA